MIDFPSNPTDGQTLTVGNKTWAWSSQYGAWNLQNSPADLTTSAQSAATAAIAARDAANAIVKVFASPSLGIAGTTNGQFFGVVDTLSLELIVYTNASGTATESYRLKLADFFNSMFPQGFQVSRNGYLHFWVDTVNRILAGIQVDGTFWSKGINLTARAVDATTALTLAQTAAVAASVVSQSPRGNNIHVWTDSTDRILAYIAANGEFWSKGVNVTTAASSAATALTLAQASATAGTVVLPGAERSSYLHVFTDKNDRILGGIRNNGELESKGINLTQSLVSVPSVVKLTIPSTNIVMYGDSLTEGAGSTGGLTVGVQLQALYSDGRTVTSSGYGGQSAQSILARLGAVPTLVSLPVGASGFPTIPASGSVNVTVTNGPLAYADASQTLNLTGSIRGVPGILQKAANTGQYSFIRTTPGAAISVDDAIPFLPDTDPYHYYTMVCWIGTNNMLSDSPASILSYIDSYMSWQITTQKRRVIVMPAIDCQSGSVSTILTTYAGLLALVKAKYPYEYIDTRSLLQRNNDGSANDLADIASGIPPRSKLAGDRYHLNTAGYGIVAAEIKRILDSKGF